MKEKNALACEEGVHHEAESPSTRGRGSGYPVSVLLVGVGGYGIHYAREMLSLGKRGLARIDAVVDPFARDSEDWPEIKELNVPRFDTLDEYFAAGETPADLAAIASPIAWHTSQSTACLQGGMNVLCEKPICATIQDAQKMAAVRNDSGRFLAIGYQWSFSEATRQLKADIMRGDFGEPVGARCWVSWPRSQSYYQRNNWAARIKDDRGEWVLDSPVNNATAHYLHHMLYLFGPDADRSARPVSLQGECYRAKPIENFDTACCRIATGSGPEIMFYSSHSTEKGQPPIFFLEFENAHVYYEGIGSVRVCFRDGTAREYGDPNADGVMHKLGVCIEKTATGRSDVPCGPEAAMMHTLCVNALQEMEIQEMAPSIRQIKKLENGDESITVPGLYDAMRRAFSAGLLFSELDDLSWAQRAQVIDLSDYEVFPSSKPLS